MVRFQYVFISGFWEHVRDIQAGLNCDRYVGLSQKLFHWKNQLLKALHVLHSLFSSRDTLPMPLLQCLSNCIITMFTFLSLVLECKLQGKCDVQLMFFILRAYLIYIYNVISKW